MASLVADYDSDGSNSSTTDIPPPVEAKKRRIDDSGSAVDSTTGHYDASVDKFGEEPVLAYVPALGAVHSTAGATSSRRLLGSRYAAHALFHRSAAHYSAPTNTDAVDDSLEAPTYSEAPAPSPQPIAAASQARQVPQQPLAASLVAQLDRAARRGLGVSDDGDSLVGSYPAVSVHGGPAGYEDQAGGSYGEYNAEATSSGGVIEISGAALRGAWVPPAAAATGGVASHKPARVAAKVWMPGAGATVTTTEASSAQKRKHQIGVVAAQALSAAALASEGTAAGYRTKAQTYSKYGW